MIKQGVARATLMHVRPRPTALYTTARAGNSNCRHQGILVVADQPRSGVGGTCHPIFPSGRSSVRCAGESRPPGSPSTQVRRRSTAGRFMNVCHLTLSAARGGYTNLFAYCLYTTRVVLCRQASGTFQRIWSSPLPATAQTDLDGPCQVRGRRVVSRSPVGAGLVLRAFIAPVGHPRTRSRMGLIFALRRLSRHARRECNCDQYVGV
jgi:hypothetical protein